jgi:hypothetical protein
MILQMLSVAKNAKLALESDFFCQMSEANFLQNILQLSEAKYVELSLSRGAFEGSQLCILRVL